jgi:hypothetical protein
MGLFDKFKKKENEITPGGSTVYKYKEADNKEWQAPVAYGEFAEDVNKHFEAQFPGRESIVLHEIVSDLVHVDVNVMKPTKEDDFFVIYTTGMSDLPMSVPKKLKEKNDLKYAELFMYLPASWDPGELHAISTDIPDENFWPIQWIKFLAKFPHEYKTWLGCGHTIPNGADYEPILDGSEMSGVLLDEPGENFSPITIKGGVKLHFYMVVPVSQAETEYKLEYGMDALTEIFAEQDIPLVVDIFRDSVV